MNEAQIEEWVENPVTRALLEISRQEFEVVHKAKADAYHFNEPQKTQEILANLNGAEDTWELFLRILEGDWSELEEADESIGDNSER